MFVFRIFVGSTDKNAAPVYGALAALAVIVLVIGLVKAQSAW